MYPWSPRSLVDVKYTLLNFTKMVQPKLQCLYLIVSVDFTYSLIPLTGPVPGGLTPRIDSVCTPFRLRGSIGFSVSPQMPSAGNFSSFPEWSSILAHSQTDFWLSQGTWLLTHMIQTEVWNVSVDLAWPLPPCQHHGQELLGTLDSELRMNRQEPQNE